MNLAKMLYWVTHQGLFNLNDLNLKLVMNIKFYGSTNDFTAAKNNEGKKEGKVILEQSSLKSHPL